MTATEATTDQHPDRSAHLETWSANEIMRHVPSLEWIIRKLDVDVRHRVDILWASVADLPSADPRYPAVEHELQSLCRALDRLADLAKHIRNTHIPADLGIHIPWALNHATSCLRTLDASVFNRRYPVQTHDRSKAEPVYAGLLVVLQCVAKATEKVSEVDPAVWEKLLSPSPLAPLPALREGTPSTAC